MIATLEKQRATSATVVNADGHQGLYIPSWSEVKDGRPIIVADVKDVAEALDAVADLKGANCWLLLRYQDGSHVITPVDCKREAFGLSWTDRGQAS